ncbi:MAG: hflK [Betaproteobacteria bacterium]|nr:hflK [Betaproteobacteria bacterium]
MSSYWQSFRGGFVGRWRRSIGVLMSLNDPQWGRGGKNSGPPDLDELMRNFNQKLGSLFGRKGGGEGRTPGGPGFAQFGGGAGLLIALIFFVWLASGFYIVDASQRGMVLRFGKFVEETLPGPHWHLPFPFETAEIVNLSQVRTIEIGSRNGGKSKVPKESLMLTDDANIIDIQFAVQYVVKNPQEFLFANRAPEDSVLQAAETAIREIVGKNTMDNVLYKGRAQITSDAQKLTQEILDRYHTGISISKVTMQNAQPPEQVQAAFDDAVKAGQDGERQKNEGQAYSNDVVPRAEGAAARLTQEAEGYKARVTERAEGDASRFRQIVTEYNKAPGVTRDRLYLDAMQEIMSNTSKVLVDQKGGNNLLYLPLDKLMQMTGPGAGTAAEPTSKPVEPSAAVEPPPSASSRSRDALRSREREPR